MDHWFSIVIIIWVFIILLYAAIRDYRIREVSNWVWVAGLFVLPITLIRLSTSGLYIIYSIQVLMNFIIVILGFRLGILGGADGKAILLISLTYPWIVFETMWLFFGSVGVLISGFLIVGVHSIILLTKNIMTWQRRALDSQASKPVRGIYWLTRRLTTTLPSDSKFEWEEVSVPLVIYILIAYTMLLGWMIAASVIFI